jgi:molybdate transport system substrate-binding protein
MDLPLHILSGGAAEALVHVLGAQFKAQTRRDIAGEFGAVGVMRDRLVAGTPADLVILTAALVAGLERDGHVVAGASLPLGVVRTGVAVREGDPAPAMGDAAALRAAFLAADGLYTADMQRATAGIHFAKVLDALGIAEAVAPRLRVHPNGNTAMRALAADTTARPIGCTQITEILGTPGVRLAGPLPPEHELATTYTIGLCRRAASPGLARQFAAMLTGDKAREAREQAGFGR